MDYWIKGKVTEEQKSYKAQNEKKNEIINHLTDDYFIRIKQGIIINACSTSLKRKSF